MSYEASSAGTQTPMEAGIAPAEKDKNRAEIGLQERDINAHDTNAANDVSKLIADALNVERERTNRPLSETDIESIGKTFKKDEWSNAGFGTIPSLIQTYYFALREGQVRRVSDCETPKERLHWLITSWSGEPTFSRQYSQALRDETEYQIESITNSPGKEYIVVVNHVMSNGTDIMERVAVASISNEWRIAGVLGRLNYGHSPGVISNYDHPAN